MVQKMINTEMRMKEASLRSDRTIEMAAPVTHIITTLYTLRPMCFESLRAGMETCLVSQAKKAPNTWIGGGGERQERPRIQHCCVVGGWMDGWCGWVNLCCLCSELDEDGGSPPRIPPPQSRPSSSAQPIPSHPSSFCYKEKVKSCLAGQRLSTPPKVSSSAFRVGNLILGEPCNGFSADEHRGGRWNRSRVPVVDGGQVKWARKGNRK